MSIEEVRREQKRLMDNYETMSEEILEKAKEIKDPKLRMEYISVCNQVLAMFTFF